MDSNIGRPNPNVPAAIKAQMDRATNLSPLGLTPCWLCDGSRWRCLLWSAVAPDSHYARLRDMSDELGGLLIMDEVMLGVGHMGRGWASEHWNICPDLVGVEGDHFLICPPMSATKRQMDEILNILDDSFREFAKETG